MTDTAAPPVLGRITIEALGTDTLSMAPRVTCEPVGLITSGWLDRHAPFIYREIEHAQAAARRAPPEPTDDSAPAARRRRRS